MKFSKTNLADNSRLRKSFGRHLDEKVLRQTSEAFDMVFFALTEYSNK